LRSGAAAKAAEAVRNERRLNGGMAGAAEFVGACFPKHL
jgi:hypothetical protein